MTMRRAIDATFRGWTDSVAGVVVAGIDRLASPRVIRLLERDDGEFEVETASRSRAMRERTAFVEGVLRDGDLAPHLRGSRVEILLSSRRFLFRPLDLPARASDFLDGIVRAQIDRLTPWTAADAVVGCSAPVPQGADGISTVIAATTRRSVMPFVNAVSALHPASVAICTDVAGPAPQRIKVFEHKARGHIDARRLSKMLQGGLAAAALAAVISVGVAAYFARDLGAQETELAREISQRRAAIRASSEGGDATPVAALERRKFDMPASVIVLEALTQVLPDHTYVTEFNLVGNKLQIVGMTRDAPSLIPLIEQSALFTRATFYAPTTRSPSDAGERFHIEARVQAKSS